MAAAPALAIDPFSDEVLTDPYPAHAELRAAGPVVWLERYGVFGLTRHADIEAVVRDPETFCSARGVGLSDFAAETPWRPPSLLLEADPPEHTPARRAVTTVITIKRVNAMRETFAAEAEAMVAPLLEAGRFDGVGDLAARYPVKVFPDQVGLTAVGRENLLPYGAMVFNGFGPRNAHFERAMDAGARVRDWVMAQTRREALADGGIGADIHAAAAEAGFDEDERALLVRSLLSAGLDTTVHGIGSALWCFATHPEEWAKLRADPSRARAAFEEVVRWESPVQVFFRTTTRAVEVAGIDIPEGSKVLMFLAAANRDPERWEDPDRFDVDRDARGHVGFGGGPHACVGQMMARLEAELVLGHLARRVESIELDGEPERELNNTVRGFSRLPVRVTVQNAARG